MDIVWLVLGILIGVLIAWWLLTKRCKTQLEEQEAWLNQARQQAEQDLEKERSAHETTKARLSDAEEKQSSAEQHAASSETELGTIRTELDQLKSMDAEAETERRRLESELEEANRQTTTLSKDLEQARTARDEAAEADRSRIGEFERRIDDQQKEIDRLQTELAARQTAAEDAAPAGAPPVSAPPASAPPAGAPSEDEERKDQAYGLASEAVSEPPEGPDDLTKIKGIGRVLEGKLHGLGVTTFRQIAEFSAADIDRINAVLDFPGRIEREQWVEQAKAFVDGS